MSLIVNRSLIKMPANSPHTTDPNTVGVISYINENAGTVATSLTKNSQCPFGCIAGDSQ